MDRFKILKAPTDVKPCFALHDEVLVNKRPPEEPIGRNFTEEFLGELIQTGEGHQRITASFTNPIRRHLDTYSLARRILWVDHLRPGAIAQYDRSPEQDCYVFDGLGENILTELNGRRVFVSIFELFCNPTISIGTLRQRRFSINRVQENACQQIRAGEETRVFDLLDRAISSDTTRETRITEFNTTGSITDVLMNAFSAIENHSVRVTNIFMNAREYADVRHHLSRDILDFETNRNLIAMGLMATLWGAQILVSRVIPVGTIYVTAEPQHVGIMPIQRDIEIFSADDPRARTIGWLVNEHIGMGCLYPQNTHRISINRTPDHE